ncbi:MAG TPA: TrmH family RNA methyltransferase, partial [Acidimicrobiales bacterium]|nr:TrmH family RNA methyltransferase [Acidimicrobiales bacterium]
MEGPKLLGEALAAGTDIQAVYLDAGESSEDHRVLAERCAASGARIFELQAGVLGRACDATTPQPIAGVVTMLDVPIDGVPVLSTEAEVLALVCLELQDPGNAGTVLRSAAAAGAGAVVFSAGSVDVYNPKSVRASAGALFRVPVVVGQGSPPELLDQLGELGLRRLGTVPQG